jgi:hypothetical protein
MTGSYTKRNPLSEVCAVCATLTILFLAAGRALIHGKMWTRDGRMVLSTAQEILIREQK